MTNTNPKGRTKKAILADIGNFYLFRKEIDKSLIKETSDVKIENLLFTRGEVSELLEELEKELKKGL